jgi:hypothetical protein
MSESRRQGGDRLLLAPVAALRVTKARGNARVRGTQGATSRLRYAHDSLGRVTRATRATVAAALYEDAGPR